MTNVKDGNWFLPEAFLHPKTFGSFATFDAIRASIPYRPQSSSASRFTAGASGFLTFTQCAERHAQPWAGTLTNCFFGP
jgi:hypothetical protein